MKRIVIALSLFGLTAWGQSATKPAAAQPADKPEIITSMTLESFQRLVQGMGFECTRGKDDKGKNEDYFSFRAEGYKVAAQVPSPEYVYLVNVFTDKIPLELINKWNQANTFSRALAGADNNLYIETEIVVTGGVTRDNIEAQVEAFRESVVRWARFVIDGEKSTEKKQ